MEKNNIPARRADLNDIDRNDDSEMLACDETLKNDLKLTCNITAIRIFHHLKDSALSLLLLSLIDYAKTDSVIFVADPINPSNNKGTAKNRP